MLFCGIGEKQIEPLHKFRGSVWLNKVRWLFRPFGPSQIGDPKLGRCLNRIYILGRFRVSCQLISLSAVWRQFIEKCRLWGVNLLSVLPSLEDRQEGLP